MDIHAACARIIGDKLAHSITMDMGVHWTVVCAMIEARTPEHNAEVAVIRAWNSERDRARMTPRSDPAEPDDRS